MAAQHLGSPTQFDVTLMDRYTYFITQCQDAAETIGELEKKREKAKEILKKYKFRIKHVVDPPTEEVACIINNYKSYKKKQKMNLQLLKIEGFMGRDFQ